MLSLITTLLGWIPKLGPWVRVRVDRLRPDHTSLAGHWGQGEGWDHFAVTVAVAPSRRLRRHGLDRLASRAETLVSTWFDDLFPAGPDPTIGRADHSSDLEVRFAEAGATLRIRPDGLLDLHVPVVGADDGAGGELLPLDQVVLVLRRVAAAVASPEYGTLVGGRRGRPRRDVDWFVGVSRYRSASLGQQPWSGIAFSGRTPVRARGGSPAYPVGGLAGPEGVGRRRTADNEPLVRASMIRLVRGAGYHDPDVPVDAALAGGTA